MRFQLESGFGNLFGQCHIYPFEKNEERVWIKEKISPFNDRSQTIFNFWYNCVLFLDTPHATK